MSDYTEMVAPVGLEPTLCLVRSEFDYPVADGASIRCVTNAVCTLVDTHRLVCCFISARITYYLSDMLTLPASVYLNLIDDTSCIVSKLAGDWSF